jgi:peptide/nickel transport system substrate-binding protein
MNFPKIHRVDVAKRRSAVKALGAASTALLGLSAMAQDKPQRSRLIGVLEEDPLMMNPAATTHIASFASGAPVYLPLFAVRPDEKVEPLLAESWTISPDGKEYVFKLRPGVTWHDGKPFTSADVKFSIENINSKLHPTGRGAFKALQSIETPEDLTVKFILSRPSAVFMNGLDISYGSILPKHLWEGTNYVTNEHNFKPVGTGPYKMVEYVRGSHIRYERNERFFMPGKPEFDELILKIIPEPAARIAAFQNGEVDMIYHGALPMVEGDRLSKLRGVKVKKPSMRGPAYLAIFNVRKAPLNEVKVRQAIAHAIDRQYLRDNVNAGYTIKMIGHVPPASLLHNANLKDYALDVATANRLLDEAGYPKKADGIRFTLDLLWPTHDNGVTKMAAVIEQNLAAVGIKLNLKPLDRATLNQRGYVGLQFDMIVETYAQGPDPDLGVERLYNSNNIRTPPAPFTNSSGYSNPEVDRLFDEQRVMVDATERKKIYDRIQEILWRDLPVLPIYSYAPPNAYRASHVEGLYDFYYGVHENYMLATNLQVKKASSGAGAGATLAGVAGAVAVAGVGAAIWLRRRAARRRD